MSCSSSSEGSIGDWSSLGSHPLTNSLSDLLSRKIGVVMEMIPDIRENPVEQLVENNLPCKGGYKWV